MSGKIYEKFITLPFFGEFKAIFSVDKNKFYFACNLTTYTMTTFGKFSTAKQNTMKRKTRQHFFWLFSAILSTF